MTEAKHQQCGPVLIGWLCLLCGGPSTPVLPDLRAELWTGASVTFSTGGEADGKGWRLEHLTKMRLRGNLRFQPMASPCSITRADQERAVKHGHKVLLCENHLPICFISKRKMLMFQAKASAQSWSPRGPSLCLLPLAGHLSATPFFWHTRMAVQLTGLSRQRLHSLGQPGHFCLCRRESEFFSVFFFFFQQGISFKF